MTPAISRWLLALGTLVAASSFAGCADRDAGTDEALRGAIFIVFDTVRADRVSTAGHQRHTTPNLEALAARGVVFEQAVSYAPWTLPSMLAILSGTWPDRPGVFAAGRLRQSLVEPMRDAGLATAAFTEGAFVSRDFGFDLGFGEYEEEEGAVQRVLPGETRDPTRGGSIERTFSRARAWLSEHARQRFFLLIHTYEPHTPYLRRTFTQGLAPGAVGEVFELDKLERLRTGALRFDQQELDYLGALYDGGIRESDRHLGELIELLGELGIEERTLVVVSSDHGEALGEHDARDVADHGQTLYDVQLRVPLVVANPAERYPVRRVTEQVRTVDILPTIAELLGIETAQTAEGGSARRVPLAGRSLVPLMRGSERDDRIAFGGLTRTLPARFFVRHRGYKYIETKVGSPNDPLRAAPPARQLYDLAADPAEQHNLIDRNPALARRLQKQLREHLEEGGPTPPTPALEAIPDALQERLRSLGYLE